MINGLNILRNKRITLYHNACIKVCIHKNKRKRHIIRTQAKQIKQIKTTNKLTLKNIEKIWGEGTTIRNKKKKKRYFSIFKILHELHVCDCVLKILILLSKVTIRRLFCVFSRMFESKIGTTRSWLKIISTSNFDKIGSFTNKAINMRCAMKLCIEMSLGFIDIKSLV